LLSIDPAAARALGPVPLDAGAGAAACALAIAVSIVSGLIPVLRETRQRHTSALSAGHRATGSRRDARLRRALVAGESALAIVLLVSSALVTAALARISTRDQGFDPSHVLGGHLRLPEAAYPTLGDRSRIVGDVLERVRALPGVVGASTTLNPLTRNFNMVTLIEIEGRLTPDASGHTVQFRRASSGYFETMRIRLTGGRTFEDRDGPDTLPVAIVSDALARRFFPGESAIGRRILRGGKPVTVVGVVGDVYDLGPGQPARPTIYIPYTQNNVAMVPATLVVRVSGDPLSVAAGIRAAVFEVDPNLPIRKLGPIDDFLDDTLAPERFRETLLAIFAALGVLIAAVGIYGVTTCVVQERTRELGVRLMLGASPRELGRLILGQSMATVAIGALLGAILAAALVVLLRQAVPLLDWRDGWAAGPAMAVLVAVAALAAGLPALRASRSDPIQSLRV
jgi:predicted permease